MRTLLTVLLLFAVLPAFAGQEALVGTWDGGDTAAMSIYGALQIANSGLSWGGNRIPKCQASYIVQKEMAGVSFEDQLGRKYVTAPGMPTYLLKISGGKFALGVTHFRLTFSLENNSDYLAMVEYQGLDRPIGYMHFYKRASGSK